MSILDFPRLHFQGKCKVDAATTDKNITTKLIDARNNKVYKNGKVLNLNESAVDFHQYLNSISKTNQDGIDEVVGWNMNGTGHFFLDNVKICSVQTEACQTRTDDKIVGALLDIWGSHHDYLARTFNRARWVDADSTSFWTSQVYAGQFVLGRDIQNTSTPNIFSAAINMPHDACWINSQHIMNIDHGVFTKEFAASRVFTLNLSKETGEFLWSDRYLESNVLKHIKAKLDKEPYAKGFTIQYALMNPSLPMAADIGLFYDIYGTIGIWYEDEVINYPSGRILTSISDKSLGPIAFKLHQNCISLNMVTSIPRQGRDANYTQDDCKFYQLGEITNYGPLFIIDNSDNVVAKMNPADYNALAYNKVSGVYDIVYYNDSFSCLEALSQTRLHLAYKDEYDNYIKLFTEKAYVIRPEKGNIFLEFPDPSNQELYYVDIKLHTFYFGIATEKVSFILKQFSNPNSYPEEAEEEEQTLLHYVDSDLGFSFYEDIKQDITYNKEVTCVSSKDGYVRVRLKGNRPSVGKVAILLPQELQLSSYDNNDELGIWKNTDYFSYRVLPNDWHLLDVPIEKVDHRFLYQHVLGYYQMLYTFMTKAIVFNFEDKCKCDTYAREMWHTCDPKNKNKSYYMPLTRDMSYAKAMLFFKYCRHIEQKQIFNTNYQSTSVVNPQGVITTKEQLISALKQAICLEFSLMTKYLYAAYSIPNYESGVKFVEQGIWTKQQLIFACGDGNLGKQNIGWRQNIIKIAHEEMIHYLAANNLLMSLGEEFFLGLPSMMEKKNPYILIDATLERFTEKSLKDFIEAELENTNNSNIGGISWLYSKIRQAFVNNPEFIKPNNSAGNEHHLFLNRKLDRTRPDFQLTVHDLDSALFLIDFISEQSESTNSKNETSHYQKFCNIAEEFNSVKINPLSPNLLWEPSYLIITNPCLEDTNGGHRITDKDTRKVAQLFEDCFELTMYVMQQHFIQNIPTLRRSRFMNASIDMMTGMIKPLAINLVQLPSGKYRYGAGPTFSYAKTMNIKQSLSDACFVIADRCNHLSLQANDIAELIDHVVIDWLRFYKQFFFEIGQGKKEAFF